MIRKILTPLTKNLTRQCKQTIASKIIRVLSNDHLEVTPLTLDTNSLKPEDLVIRVLATPLNPLDLLKIQGVVKGVTYPFTPGSEGVGVIIQAKDRSLIGRIASFTNAEGGCWRQHVVNSIDNTILHQKSLDPSDDQQFVAAGNDPQITRLACGFVNPVTCLGLLNEATQNGNQGIVNLAANSALGQMVYRCASAQGLQVINVVRTAQRVQQLQSELGKQAIIFDSTDTEFSVKLHQKTEELKIRAALDPIGGPLTGIVFNALPDKSQVINYGSLGGKDISGINMVQLRFGEKSVRGFVFFRWYFRLPREKKEELKTYITQNFEKYFQTKITKVFQFEEVDKALSSYRANMSEGKILLRP